MSKSNTSVKSTLDVITRSQAKQDSGLAEIVNQSKKSPLKIKSVKDRENVSDNKYQKIPNPFPNEQELYNCLQLDDSSLDKTLIDTQSMLSENSGKSSRFHSSFCPDLSIVTGSNNTVSRYSY